MGEASQTLNMKLTSRQTTVFHIVVGLLMISRILAAPAFLAGCSSMMSLDPDRLSLTDNIWKLEAIRSMDDAQGTTHIDRPELYTLSFGTNGRLSLRIDCNRGSAAWKSVPSADPASGMLEIGVLATTKAMCPPGSLDQKVLRDLPYVRTYLLKDGKLYLSLMADGGVYEWRPAAR